MISPLGRELSRQPPAATGMEQEQAMSHGRTAATRFTALELSAAEQLVHLSESSCSYGSSGAAFSFSPRGAPSAASASSSPRSVHAPALHSEDEDDVQEVGGRPRRNRRHRPIAEIYDVTELAGGARRRKDGKAAGAREDSQRRK